MNTTLLSKNKINKALEKIKNIHPDKKIEIENFLKDDYDISLNDLIIKIRKFLDIKPMGSHTNYYWTSRGWPAKPASVISKKSGQLSPFNYKFWIEKGMSEEDAKWKANSIRPIKKEYWIEKGYSCEEAEQLAIEAKCKNNKNGAKSSKNRDTFNVKLSSNRCLEYWINYHLGDIDKAKKSLSDTQRTFSKDICIEKHGEENGLKIWKDRQEKWIKSLNENNDMKKINLKKSNDLYSFKLRFDDEIEAIEKYKEFLISKNIPLIESYEDFIDFCFKENKYLLYKTFEKIKEDIPNYILNLLSDEDINKIKDNFPLIKNTFKPSFFHCMYTRNGKLLRSSNEIEFYNKLLLEGFVEDEDFYIERYYNLDFPNIKTAERSDFYFIKTKQHVEIIGMMYLKEYENKMIQKKTKFNCILVEPNDIINFIETYKRENYDRI